MRLTSDGHAALLIAPEQPFNSFGNMGAYSAEDNRPPLG
jgi:hypothetical protein